MVTGKNHANALSGYPYRLEKPFDSGHFASIKFELPIRIH